MGLSRTVSEKNGVFSRKIANFSHPVYFAPSLKEMGTCALGQKSKKMRLQGHTNTIKIGQCLTKLQSAAVEFLNHVVVQVIVLLFSIFIDVVFVIIFK